MQYNAFLLFNGYREQVDVSDDLNRIGRSARFSMKVITIEAIVDENLHIERWWPSSNARPTIIQTAKEITHLIAIHEDDDFDFERLLGAERERRAFLVAPVAVRVVGVAHNLTLVEAHVKVEDATLRVALDKIDRESKNHQAE